MWQEHAAAVAAASAKELLSFVPVQSVGGLPIKQEFFQVGFSLLDVPETEFFVGRDQELSKMSILLHGHERRQTVVLHGLGGIGKTQLAASYCRQHSSEYSAVFWFNSKDPDTLKRSFLRAAERIFRDQPALSYYTAFSATGNLDEIAKAVKDWLNTPQNSEWLLVYDNYDLPKLPGDCSPNAFSIDPFLPEVNHGAVIITTRSSSFRKGSQIPVKKLSDLKQSLAILSYTSRREGLENDLDACELARQLDGLPLALATAGAYLDQVLTSFGEYLCNYRAKWLRLQERSPHLLSYEKMLYSTWNLSLDHIEHNNPSAVRLLKLWAYFDNDDIWIEILQDYNEGAPQWFLEIMEDQISFDDTMRVLCSHALVESNAANSSLTESRGYSMHSCVHSWTTHFLNQEWDLELARLAVTCVGNHGPSIESAKYWAMQQRLLQHANRSFYLIVNVFGDWNTDVSMLRPIRSIGRLFKNTGKLAEAEELSKLVLDAKERSPVFGPDHTSTLSSMHSLAILFRKREKLDEAERLYLRALHGYQNSPEDCTEAILTIYDNLGIVYWKLKKYDESGRMYSQALEGKKTELGKCDVSTLNTVNNFALLRLDQGKLVEAEALFQAALEGYESEFGIEHKFPLNTVSNIGFLRFRQGRLDEAEKLLNQALEGYKKISNDGEICSFEAAESLGHVYEKQGRLHEAEKMYQQALVGFRNVFGSSHDRCHRILEAVMGLGQGPLS